MKLRQVWRKRGKERRISKEERSFLQSRRINSNNDTHSVLLPLPLSRSFDKEADFGSIGVGSEGVKVTSDRSNKSFLVERR